jgi:hypothetical protein
MKKICLLSLFGLLVSLTTFAQSPLRLGLRISPMVSFAGITDKDKNDISSLNASGKIGFGGGLVGVYQFTDKFGFQSGLQICTRGFSFTQNNLEQSSNVTIIEIPTLLHMRSNDITEGIKVRGIFGSTIGILAGASSEIKMNGVTNSDKKGENFSALQFDFTFGGGVEWSLGNAGTIDIGLSYHLPLILLSDKIAFPNSGQGNGYDFKEARVRLGYLALDLSYYF